MKKIGIILLDVLYWMVAVALIASGLLLSDYSLEDSLVVALMFIPGCMILKFTIPKLSFRNMREGIVNLFFILCAVVLTVLMMLLISHVRMYYSGLPYVGHRYDIPSFLMNPFFVLIAITVLATGDYLLMRRLSPPQKDSSNPITFTSDYKKVTLDTSEIMYVESRDTEVWIHASEGRQFRNKTGISQWENLLGEDFVRVHRSYLVRRSSIVEVSPDSLTLIDGTAIPISKKYRETIGLL